MRYDRCHSFNIILNKWSSLIRWRSLIKLTHPHNNPIVVATNGCFDILHVGHLAMLEAAAKLGDYLVVGLNSDSSVRQIKGPRRPINTEKDRKRLLEGLRCVNNVHIFDESNAARFLEVAKPHYYIKSADYSLETMNKQERDVLFKMGTVIRFVPLVEGKSTTQTISCLKS